MYFFSSDWHLCHANIIKTNRRDFVSEEQRSFLELADRGTIPYSEVCIDKSQIDLMNSTIIENTNKVVGEKDTLILLGDFCWSKDQKVAKSFVDQINCKNIYMIWGNHDRPSLIGSLFKGCFFQYLWKIGSQKVFTSHFPCRVWDCSDHGSWMLYGHCHNSLWEEDNFELKAETINRLNSSISDALGEFDLTVDQKRQIILKTARELVRSHGLRLTLDVGVDNRRPGVPFGTPWSFEEIEIYMRKKREAWFCLF